MSTERAPRNQLHEFLRAARARVQPEDIGLRPAANRRGGGLHQSDVADALVVSDRWYNAFENGALPRPKYEEAVDRVCGLLRLRPAERHYVHLLATGREPVPPLPAAGSSAVVRDVLDRFLGLLGPHLPALVCDVAWNVLAWNQAMTDHIAGAAVITPGRTNVLVWLFTSDAERIVANLSQARETEIGNVLLALARYPGDQRLQQLAERLRAMPDARALWDRQRIPNDLAVSSRRLRLTSGGVCEADLVSLELPGAHRLLALVPQTAWLAAGTPDGHRQSRRGRLPALGLSPVR